MVVGGVIIVIVFAMVVAGMWSSIAAAATTGSPFQVLITAAGNIMGAFAVIAATYLWLNSHNLKFFLCIQRQRHRLFPSKSSTWDIQARWYGSGTEEALLNFEEWLKSYYANKLSIWKHLGEIRSYQVDGRFNVEVSCELSDSGEGESNRTFVLRIYALTVNFAESKDVLNTDVMPLLEKMSSFIRPLPQEQAYNLTMSFTDRINPFLGLYVQGLHPREIKQFQVTVTPLAYDKEARSIIRVSPEKLSITAHSARDFEMMTVDFVSFAPRLIKTTN